MMGVEMLSSCRAALRIPADCAVYDDEIVDLIDAARSAMVAGGVSPQKANSGDDGMIRLAIKVYVKAHFGMDNPDAERLAASFDSLLTTMRGSAEYGGSK